MTYIVKDRSIKYELWNCAGVYPTDCFYEGKNILVIKLDECIDHGTCESECLIDAIKSDTELSIEKWLEKNKKYSEIWPNINKKNPSADANSYRNDQDECQKIF